MRLTGRWRAFPAASASASPLVRALQLRPQVLLLDEPTSALDPEAVSAAEAVIRAEAQRGVAVLLVSHDAAQRARLGDVFYTISHGRLAAAA